MGSTSAYWSMPPEVFAAGERITPGELASLEGYVAHGQTNLEWGLATLEQEAWLAGDYIGNAIEAMLSSMVVGTWTAFETVAGDLWVATMNAHPRDLDRLKGEEKRISKEAKKLGRQTQLETLGGQAISGVFLGRPVQEQAVFGASQVKFAILEKNRGRRMPRAALRRRTSRTKDNRRARKR